MPTRLLAEAGHDITVFYANSNIAPESEYLHRLEELQKYAGQQGFDVIEGMYDPQAWEREVAPIGEALKQFSPAFGEAFAQEHLRRAESGCKTSEEATASSGRNVMAGAKVGAEPDTDADPVSTVATSAVDPALTARSGAAAASVAFANVKVDSQIATPTTVAELLDDERRKERCRACYRMRLEEAAAAAAQGGYDALTTTLAVSPYQFTDVICEELERASGRAGVKWHFEDYRPYYDEATRISRELGMYRQNYCGCRFSVREGEATRAFVKQLRKAQKAERQKQRAEQEAARKEETARKQAYAQAQAKKKAILKAMRSARNS